MIKGKCVKEALELSNKAVVEALDGLPAQKIHCSVLAEEAVKAAIDDYYEKNPDSIIEELLRTREKEEESSCSSGCGGCSGCGSY
jgi:nitrogen fixation NifU-like protein